MGRRRAREIVLCLVFEKEYHKEMDYRELFDTVVENNQITEIYNSLINKEDDEEKNDKIDYEYIKNVFFGVFENLDRIDTLISNSSISWSNNRISKVSMAILRICVCEILFIADVPVSAAINEAVELSKKYDHADAFTFINGVMGAIAKGV